jgi:DNA primase
MRAILKAASKINELSYTLDNISADDGKEWDDYTDAEIVDEAEYVLHTFYEDGHYNGQALSGENEDGEYDQKWARGEVRKLKSLIKKYKTADGKYSPWLRSIGQAVK